MKFLLDKVICLTCRNVYHELADEALGICPHCKCELDEENTKQVETIDVEVTVDSLTGEIKVEGGMES